MGWRSRCHNTKYSEKQCFSTIIDITLVNRSNYTTSSHLRIMDPLSALSVAASVVQFVDFGRKIVSKTNEIHNSSKGESIDNALTEATAKRLTILAKDLESSLQLEGHQDLPSDKTLYNICVSCIILGNQLTARFDKLRVHSDAKHRAWKSFRQALKSVWSKGRSMLFRDNWQIIGKS